MAPPVVRASRSLLLLAAWLSAGTGARAEQVGWKPFSIPSASMSPTLQVGDVMFVTPAASIGRGDVIVFVLPGKPSVTYVKRVIGLPGDHVRLRGGVVDLNGMPLRRDTQGQATVAVGGGQSTTLVMRYRETLPGGRSYEIAKMTDSGPANDTPDIVVPEGAVFVMGDNRDDSLDSRFPDAFGVVPIDDIHGVARIIYWSSDPSRILKPVE